MNFNEHEKNMLLIALRNEGRQFERMVDELLEGFSNTDDELNAMITERIAEYREVAEEYQALFEKIAGTDQGW